MDNNQVPLRGRAAEKEKVIITQEDIDKVVHLVMEEGYSMEYAVKMSTGFTPNTFRKKAPSEIPRAIRRSQKAKPVQRQSGCPKGSVWMGQIVLLQLLVA